MHPLLVRVIAFALALASFARPIRAQSGASTQGAAFLLIPIGARSLAMGQAAAAEELGVESIWWNPAGLARADQREAAIHHLEVFAGKGNAVSFLYPSSKLGVLAASIYILDFGEIATADRGGTSGGGALLPRNFVYAATYATTIGSNFNAGVTFKLVQFRIDCSGDCSGVPGGTNSTTTAVDLGAQYDLGALAPLTLGLAIRHLGPKLQVNDREQADPLPTRLDIGASYRVTQIARYSKDLELRLTGDLIDDLVEHPRFDSPNPHFGAALSLRKRYHLRAGYAYDRSDTTETSGASLGLGLTTGGLNIDLARPFNSIASGSGQAPVYLSLRYQF